MMEVKIHAKLLDRKLKVALMAMCHHALKELGVSKRLRDNMRLDVHLRHHEAEGEAKVDDFENIYRPRHFRVILDHHRMMVDNYGREKGETEWAHDLLKTLAHELVHVKDYVLGDLAMRKEGLTYRGVHYSGDTLLDYFKFPYEVEAYGKELGLLVSFLAFWGSVENELELD